MQNRGCNAQEARGGDLWPRVKRRHGAIGRPWDMKSQLTANAQWCRRCAEAVPRPSREMFCINFLAEAGKTYLRVQFLIPHCPEKLAGVGRTVDGHSFSLPFVIPKKIK